MRRHAMQGIVKDVVVREAELGDDSVPVGAAGLALAWAGGEPVDDGT